MTTIQSGTPSIHRVRGGDSTEIGSAEILGASRQAAAVPEHLVALAAQQAAPGAKGTAGPMLRQPNAPLASAPALERDVKALMETPALRERMDRLHKLLDDVGVAFDINQMSAAGFTIADLLNAIKALLGQSRINESKLNAKMTINGEDAVNRTGASIKSAGISSLSSGITQGGFSIGGAAAGIGMKLKSQSIKRQNARNTDALASAKKDTQDLNDALTKAQGKAMPGKINEPETGEIKAADGGARKVNIAPSDDRLSDAHRATLAKPANDAADIEAEAIRKAIAHNENRASNWNLAGEAASGVTHAGTTAVGAGNTFVNATEQANQKFSELDTRVLGQTGDNARERAQSAAALLTEMVNAMVAALQSRSATASAVTGNIRA